MEIVLANPRGFCAGVDRAIEIVNRALDMFGAPIYVRHEVVHNRFVVDNLRARGAIFVDELADIPDNSTVIFSAHGVAQSVRLEATERGLKIFDATCPLVTKVHMEVSRHCRNHREVILIGHAGHPEVEGTMGQYDADDNSAGIYLVEKPQDIATLAIKNPDDLAFVTQTTLSVDDTTIIIKALQSQFPNIVGPRKDDICYATQNRQDAVKLLTEQCDLILIVGSRNSSNSNRLRELGTQAKIDAYLIDGADDIQGDWLEGHERVGVSAGASAPEVLVEEVIERLKQLGGVMVAERSSATETIVFPLPKELRA
ncbi:MAG TPA: 4-hydroxy-3-methylbut-2-enyl diphosphate reductase [Chromatiaceae bacterium]|nr:4-hydroxy-3-methylbut-2-enyl diphosphate reductase [Chromatiaceae bacterium]HIN82187.1 4-hydroxy-3-methylbut-2-enyl diphosphate reductase [Chromatiales bacterium]HIA07520.1 4-hydroxy-3-methylbut-2-enyl diphosphate reductase [Chromatiaceae bacterium]HIB85445.1 4-hydroxy-3-methylbut-2-enyl diphosphate reductase [Chromatiaceae bacterium]HIO14751.1 4-hydroxy-3-methylbut-2-enyl diphosphate reductase [Chromatiales bacterium]